MRNAIFQNRRRTGMPTEWGLEISRTRGRRRDESSRVCRGRLGLSSASGALRYIMYRPPSCVGGRRLPTRSSFSTSFSKRVMSSRSCIPFFSGAKEARPVILKHECVHLASNTTNRRTMVTSCFMGLQLCVCLGLKRACARIEKKSIRIKNVNCWKTCKKIN